MCPVFPLLFRTQFQAFQNQARTLATEVFGIDLEPGVFGIDVQMPGIIILCFGLEMPAVAQLQQRAAQAEAEAGQVWQKVDAAQQELKRRCSRRRTG